jgi:hypothetical protein
MKIERNPIYKCDICGVQGEWIKGQWIAHVFPIRHDEYEFHLCSENCDEKILALTKTERIELYKITRSYYAK